MPDVVTVAGVEPEILVEYVGNAYPGDTTERLDLAKDDDGSPRTLRLNGDPLLLTNDEVSAISRNYQLKMVEDTPAEVTTESVEEVPPEQAQPPVQEVETDIETKTLPDKPGYPN